jgi:hypothetical protein
MTNYAKKRPDWIENPTSRKDGEKWGTHLHCLLPDIQAKKAGMRWRASPFEMPGLSIGGRLRAKFETIDDRTFGQARRNASGSNHKLQIHYFDSVEKLVPKSEIRFTHKQIHAGRV